MRKRPLAPMLALVGFTLASVGQAQLARGRSFRGTALVGGAFGFQVPHVAHVDAGSLYLFTHNLNPDTVVYNDHPTGLSYLDTTTGWGLINAQQEPMSIGADFNFLDASGIGHSATGTYPVMPLPAVPASSIPFISPVFGSGFLDPWPTAVQWTGFEWQALGAEPILMLGRGAASPMRFNVLPIRYFIDRRLRIVTADAGTTSGYPDSVVIDHPAANGRPSANLLVTQRLETSDTWSNVLPARLGVWYNGNDQRWRVFREDRLAMPFGATFAVLVSDALLWDGFETGNTCFWSSTVPATLC